MWEEQGKNWSQKIMKSEKFYKKLKAGENCQNGVKTYMLKKIF